MGDNSGPQEAIKGTVEGIKGKAKEAAGSLIGDDKLDREGKAQQDKADAQLEVAKKEAAAEKARGEARIHEERERAEQQR